MVSKGWFLMGLVLLHLGWPVCRGRVLLFFLKGRWLGECVMGRVINVTWIISSSASLWILLMLVSLAWRRRLLRSSAYL